MTEEPQSDGELECGCAVHFAPCEVHLDSLSTGKETLHISARFDDKYSRFAGNRHNVNLERVQRIELGLDSEPMEFSEVTVANMLQGMADERPYESDAFVLRALANALRGKDDHHRLLLKQKKPGKWESPSDDHSRHRKHLAWIIRLSRLQAQGWQTDAAVHRIAETTGNSVSRIYSGIAEERTWQAKLSEFTELRKLARKLLQDGKLSPESKS